MSKEKLDSMIKSNSFDTNVFLLWGKETHLRNHYLNKLTKCLSPEIMPDMNIFKFLGKDYSLLEVDEAIEALPVMDEKKLLIFQDSLLFKADARTGAKAEVREYWQKRLKDIPDYVSIIFSEEEIDKRSALYKEIEKNKIAVEFSYLDEAKMTSWTVSLFKSLGKKISTSDAKYLVSICPEGMMSVKREAEKLCSYNMEKDEVSLLDIKELVTPKLEDKVFEMINAMLLKNTQEAIAMLKDLLLLKTDLMQIMGAIIYNLDKIYCIKLLKKEGCPNAQIASKLKIAPFMVGKYADTSSKYAIEDINHFIKRATETDISLKSNSMDNEVLVELLVYEMSSK